MLSPPPCIFGIFICLTTSSFADSWSRPEPVDYYSRSRQYLLHVEPDNSWPSPLGRCQAELFRIEGDKRTRIWSRFLINDRAPVKAFVADSGRYVVTMDDWHAVGDLPVVIYGPLGSLLYVHNLDGLRLEPDSIHITMSVSSFWWSENSLVFFSPDSEKLLIRLHWGRLLVIDLASGRMTDEVTRKSERAWSIKAGEWKQLHEFAKRRIEELAIAQLKSTEVKDRETGAIVAGQIALKEALPLLRGLLSDEAFFTEGLLFQKKRYFVREAAAKAIDQIEGRRSTSPAP